MNHPMKKDPVRKNAPFIRILAVFLALIILQTSVAWAVSPVPGSLAVLEPPMPLPEMRAAWDGIRSAIYLDPLLLAKGREDVQRELEEWRLAAESVRSAYRTADRISLDRTQTFLDEAWAFYYQFDYDQAGAVLNKAKELLLTPGDSRFRTQLMFEVLVVSGVVARAAGDKNYISEFNRAAALDPVRDLSSDRYSPETISIYNRTRSELLDMDRVSLFIDGTPADAAVMLGGIEHGDVPSGAEYLVWPGKHFIEVSAAGYEPWGLIFDAQRFESYNVRFDLVPTGPEGDPDSFFLQRFKAGDRPYMVRLAEKLDVDYLLLPDPDESALRAWLIDREGRSEDHVTLWEAGDTLESGMDKAARLLEPLRQEWDHSRTTAGAPVSLPAISQGLPEGMKADGESPTWRKYAIAVGVLLLVGAAAGAERGGGTRIEATW